MPSQLQNPPGGQMARFQVARYIYNWYGKKSVVSSQMSERVVRAKREQVGISFLGFLLLGCCEGGGGGDAMV